MNRLLIISLAAFGVSMDCAADEILFRNGSLLKNVLVVDTIGSKVEIKSRNRTRSLSLENILKITRSPYDPDKDSYYEDIPDLPVEIGSNRPATISSMKRPLPKVADSTKVIHIPVEYPNPKLLPLSILAFGLSWDYLKEASDAGAQIDQQNKLPGADTSPLVTLRDRKTFLGVIFLGAGIINAVISLQAIEIRTSNDSVTLSYSF